MDEVKNQTLKEKIIDTAEESFAEHGYGNTKMLDVAQKAGVNHALIHYYFSTKEHLYETVVNRLFEKWRDQIRSFDWTSADPETVLRTYITQYFAFHVESENLQKIRTWDRMEQRNLFDMYINKYWFEDLENKADQIKLWQEDGYIRNDLEPKLIMHTIWNSINYFSEFGEAEFQIMLNNSKTIK